MADLQEEQEVIKFFSGIPWLQQLLEADIVKVARAVTAQRFGPGEVIVSKGASVVGYYYIWKGQAVVSSTDDSPELVLEKGHYFGTIGLDVLEATVTARNKVVCLVLDRKDIELLFPNYLWIQDMTVASMMQLRKLDEDCWQGENFKGAPRGVVLRKGQPPRETMFGGQFISQALAAAVRSVNPSLAVHSFHSYFLYGGDFSLPVVYKVERTRDGKSFATRLVTAFQRGRKVYMLLASFQRQEENIDFQDRMPDVADPSELPSEEQTILSQLGDPRIPVRIRTDIATNPMKTHPLDVRLCVPENYNESGSSQNVWIRCKEKLPDDPALHRCVAAYASDWWFLQAFIKSEMRPKFKILSLDHSMWFHKDFKADEWLLFKITSPRASGSRGLVIGHMFTQSGELVVTAVQQGLARPRRRNSSL